MAQIVAFVLDCTEAGAPQPVQLQCQHAPLNIQHLRGASVIVDQLQSHSSLNAKHACEVA